MKFKDTFVHSEKFLCEMKAYRHLILRLVLVVTCSASAWLTLQALMIPPHTALKPLIGLSHRCSDEVAISTIPMYLENNHSFLEAGLQAGDTIPRFKLYTPDNHAVD